MGLIQVEYLWQAQGWLGPAWIKHDDSGKILEISSEKPDGSVDQVFSGAMIPAFVNAHSHAFQYLISGLAENHNPGTSDFWGWRQLMYKALARLTPTDLKVAATTAFNQMLRRGYCHIVEFHYLQRDPNGEWYPEASAMADALIQAAAEVGMGITLIPVYYHQSSFDRPIEDGQKRFYFSSLEEYRTYVQSLHQAYQQHNHVLIGSGLHSLRTASQEEAIAILNEPAVAGPVHLHIAEQQKEVDDCLKHWGQRPMEWLLSNISLESHHHLVHATHLTKAECEELSQKDSTVVICPSTEANLGDGIFPFVEYWSQGGKWTFGSDSQVGLCPLEELRWLDYTMRLHRQKRFTYPSRVQGELGEQLCNMAWHAGNQAAGLAEPLSPGSPLNACILDLEHPRLIGKDPGSWLSSLVFAGDHSLIAKLIQGGKVRFEKQLGEQERAHPAYGALMKNINAER